MNRILLIFFCVIYGQCICAQYRVYAYQGKVQYKVHGKNSVWQDIKADTLLDPIDSLWVSRGSYVRIEQIQQHRIYNTFKKGKYSVYALIEQAKEENSKRIINSLNKDISSNKVTPMKHSMNVLGGSARSPHSTAVSTVELAKQLAWIGAKACSGEEIPIVDSIIFKQLKQDNGEIYFEFENRTAKDYYINVLHINVRSNTASLCYVISPQSKINACPITPSGCRTFGMNISFPLSKDDIYVLVVMNQPYDSYALDDELLRHKINDATKVVTDIKYMW